MQIHRLFEIIYILINKKRVTAGELAEHFEVSRRTILRDIDTLTIAGIPIYTSQGRGGGISILDNYVLDKTAISGDEQNQIIMALQSLDSVQNVDSGKLLSKLTSLFNKADTNWIEVDFSHWGKSSSDKERFEILKRAILKKQAVTFAYSSSYGETSDRKIYPLKLVFKSRAWYLQAYCLLKNDYRIFKISRMLSVEATSDRFSEEFAPPPIEPENFTSSDLVHLELCFAPHAAYRVYDEFDAGDVVKNEDGSFTVKVSFPNDYWLYGFLLSFGTAVKVVKPAIVRDVLLEQAKEIISIYL